MGGDIQQERRWRQCEVTAGREITDASCSPCQQGQCFRWSGLETWTLIIFFFYFFFFLPCYHSVIYFQKGCEDVFFFIYIFDYFSAHILAVNVTFPSVFLDLSAELSAC